MIEQPWSLVLTAVFVCTGAYCLTHLRSARRGSRIAGGALTTTDSVHLTHLVMSVSMIAMVWWYFSDALLWGQVALFVVLGAGLLLGLGSVQDRGDRVDLVSHAVLVGAMVWMLAAMPWLMAGHDMGDAGGGGHAGHGGGMTMVASAPAWVDVANLGFVVASVACGAWWVVRALQLRGPRLHQWCHVLMAAGMAGMLVLMSS